MTALEKAQNQVYSFTRPEERQRKQERADERKLKEICKTVPSHFLNCRGCGISFQCKDEKDVGYVPRHHLVSYLERTKLQMDAAAQDLRIRSGGGKGQGTAIAALHASLKAALVSEHTEANSRRGKGAFTFSKLEAMGLDQDFQPLPRVPEYDEHGNKIHIKEPEEAPAMYNQYEADRMRREKGKRLHEMMRDPEADPEEINKLSAEKYRPEVQKDDINNRVLDQRDVAMLERAAKSAAKPLRCMRCFQLANNAVAGSVASVGAEDFVQLLHEEFMGPNAKPAVIIKLVDLIDFHGSFIQNFKKIVGGRHPIILGVNKLDVLPMGVTYASLHAWVKKEVAKYDIPIHSICLFSARTGRGVEEMMFRATQLARGKNDENAPKNRNIYIVGTTNVGKSTLVNQLMKSQIIGTGLINDTNVSRNDRARVVRDAVTLEGSLEGTITEAPKDSDEHPLLATRDTDPNVNRVVADIDVAGVPLAALNAVIPTRSLIEHHQTMLAKHAVATTSPMPGTTLGITSFPILEKKRGGKNIQLRDTPGVLNAHQLSSYMHYDELKSVLPTRRIIPHSYRVKTGQSLLFGGLARVDMIAGRPFNIACFAAPKVTVHIAPSHRVTEDYLYRNLGVLMMPPYDPDNRVGPLNIYHNIGVTEAEAEALKELTETSKEEFKSSMGRAKQRMGYLPSSRMHPDEYTEAITTSLDAPRSGRDRAAGLRVQGKEATDNVMSKVAPVEAAISDISYPARSFIDAKGRIVFQLQGAGWNEASHDIVIAGLGWISVTGAGPITLRVSVAGERFDIDDATLAETARIAKASDDIGGGSTTALPSVVQKAYSRTMVRNPVLPDLGRINERFVGTPEALKKPLTNQQEVRRENLRRQREDEMRRRNQSAIDLRKKAAKEEEEDMYEDEDQPSVLSLEYGNAEAAARSRRAQPRDLSAETERQRVLEGFEHFNTPEPERPRKPRRTEHQAAWDAITDNRQQKLKESHQRAIESGYFPAEEAEEGLEGSEGEEYGEMEGFDEHTAEMAAQAARFAGSPDADAEDDMALHDDEYAMLENADFSGGEAFAKPSSAPQSKKSALVDEFSDGELSEESMAMLRELDLDSDAETGDQSMDEAEWRAIVAFQKERGLGEHAQEAAPAPAAASKAQPKDTGMRAMKNALSEKPRVPILDDIDDIPTSDRRHKFQKADKNGRFNKYDEVLYPQELKREASDYLRNLKVSDKGINRIRETGSALNPGDEVFSLDNVQQLRGRKNKLNRQPLLEDDDLDFDADDMEMLTPEQFAALDYAEMDSDIEAEAPTRSRSSPYAAQHTAHGSSDPNTYEAFYTAEEKAQRGVATGPNKKRETGGRRARKAMGYVVEDKYAEVRYMNKTGKPQSLRGKKK